MRLVVPNGSCGGIIGKGGATIRYHSFSLSSCRAYLFAIFMKLLVLIQLVFDTYALDMCFGNMFWHQVVVSYMSVGSLVSELLFP